MGEESDTTTDDIGIERWVILERLRLDEFMAFWRNGQAGLDPHNIPINAFPVRQPVEEWDEQYRSWGGG